MPLKGPSKIIDPDAELRAKVERMELEVRLLNAQITKIEYTERLKVIRSEKKSASSTDTAE